MFNIGKSTAVLKRCFFNLTRGGSKNLLDALGVGASENRFGSLGSGEWVWEYHIMSII